MKGSTLILLGVVGGTVACDAPEVNGNTVGIIKQLEGFRANLYDDGYGTQHVGYGHACKQKDCAELPYPIPISEADAEKVLIKDLGVRC
ncbi:hypothetical protein NLG97_g5278 [Lecanicillium saksenae]|uniref:Uncharacterized protein n=1 Tax=Lecanicillium saksenae TaxID=468837 RepID=A0ACC1QSV4_9HYPO|nr:hypothetical protein NLG97_g5278 [Lecanicillium saksenae]